MKVLVTAFSSFPGVDTNPSQVLLESWDKPKDVQTELLPVSYGFCKEWSDSRIDFDIVIHLGVAVDRESNCLESTAYKKVGSSLDVDGEMAAEDIGEQAHYKTYLDLEFLNSNLQSSDFNVSISHSAGDYLCNFIYYLSLEKAALKEQSVLFVHIPKFDVISQESQLKFLDQLLEEVIDQHQSRIH